MPKLPGSLAEVSTVITPMPEGARTLEIVSVEVGKSKSKLDMVTVEYKVINDEEFNNRRMRDYMVLQGKDGNPNEAGLRSLKRLIIAALGEERADAEDFDTDELQGAQVAAMVVQDSYTDDAGEEVINNKIKKILPAK